MIYGNLNTLCAMFAGAVIGWIARAIYVKCGFGKGKAVKL